MTRWSFKGVIATAAFTSGDRFLAAVWDDTPLGRVSELRWTKPDGAHALLVADEPSAELLRAIHPSDSVDVVELRVTATDRWIELVAGPVELQLQAKTGWRVPFNRPPIVTQLVEDRLARRFFGAPAFEHTPTGVRAWYRADVVRPVAAGWATVDGRDLGALRGRPAMVAVRPLFEDPTGRLDEVVHAAARTRVIAPRAE